MFLSAKLLETRMQGLINKTHVFLNRKIAKEDVGEGWGPFVYKFFFF